MVIKEINYIFTKILKYIHMTAKEELIERLFEYNKILKEKTKNMNMTQLVIYTSAEKAKLFREKFEENNNLLK